MTNLFVSYFDTTDKVRQEEVAHCFAKNFLNHFIDKIYIIFESSIYLPDFSVRKGMELEFIYVRRRPTYNAIFDLIKIHTSANDINIISNSDIYFDETLEHVKAIQPNDIYALCRWECSDGKFLNRRDSQDAWIMKGHPRNVQAGFTMGIPGCDNAIADRFAKVGYNVISPSKTIKTWHLHSTSERTYNPSIRIPMPYKFMEQYT